MAPLRLLTVAVGNVLTNWEGQGTVMANPHSGTVVLRVGDHTVVQWSVWPSSKVPLKEVLEVVDARARAAPSRSLLVESVGREAVRFSALVHGYGCSCAEEVELWEKAGLIVVGVGQAVTVLDVITGAVKLRVPMNGYFNALWLAEDGRDAFVCSDEQVVRLVPPGVVGWHKTLGMDGVLVHRAVGMTVFVSAQRRVGGPWVDYLLDRTTGAILEAPDPDEDADPDKKGRAGAEGSRTVVQEEDTAEDVDANAVKMVRDDETDPEED